MSDDVKDWIAAVRLASQEIDAEAENDRIVEEFRRTARNVMAEGRAIQRPMEAEIFAEMTDEEQEHYAREVALPWWFPTGRGIVH